MKESVSGILGRTTEQERPPMTVFMMTRHADRLPSGKLSEEGEKKAVEKGSAIGLFGDDLVFKGYASDEKSDRTYLTSEILSKESGIRSPLTDSHYETRRVANIQYDILRPDFDALLKEGSNLIEEKTLEELGLSTERDDKGKFKISLTEFPSEEQERIATVRAKNQIWAFRLMMQNPEAVHRMAMAMAYQQLKESKIADRYNAYRVGKQSANPQKDLMLNTTTHGLFIESLLLEAGYMDVDGVKQDIKLDSKEFGGYIRPLESVYFRPDKMEGSTPIFFDGPDRPGPNEVFVDIGKLVALGGEYEEFLHRKQESYDKDRV